MIVFLTLDIVFFDYLYWKIPNESSWGENFFYNFVYEKKRISSLPKQKDRLFILGSSIARYSIHPKLLETELKNNNHEFDVHLISHAGLTPIDAYLQRAELLNLKPDAIIYPLNYIDFRLFRKHELLKDSLLSEENEGILIRDALDFQQAPQVKHSNPSGVLTDFYSYLNPEEIGFFLSSSIFSSYRYRELIAHNVIRYLDHRNSRNTRYFWYQGVQIPERVSTLGWTGRQFSFRVIEKMVTKGVYFQIVPEVLEDGKLHFQIIENGQYEEFTLLGSGWKEFRIPSKYLNKFITIELKKTWRPNLASGDRFDYAREEKGVRIQETFGLESPRQNYHIYREERSEDLRFLKMNRNEYREYFEYRLLSDRHLRPGMVTLHIYKESKLKLNQEKFSPLFQYRYLKLFSEYCNENHLKLILIHNPENPVSLEWYNTSEFFRDQEVFFQSLKNEYVYYKDLSSYLDEQDFSDYHHMTYPGMEKMNPKYARIVEEVFRNE